MLKYLDAAKKKIDKQFEWDVVPLRTKGRIKIYINDLLDYSICHNKICSKRIIDEIIKYYNNQGWIVKRKGLLLKRLVFTYNKENKIPIKNKFEMMDFDG